MFMFNIINCENHIRKSHTTSSGYLTKFNSRIINQYKRMKSYNQLTLYYYKLNK